MINTMNLMENAMKRNTPALLVVGICLLLVLGLAPAAQTADMGAKIGQACSACHSTKRICFNLGAKGKGAWKVTVDRMVGMGAQISSDRVAEAVDYLSGLQQGQASFCR